MRTFPFALGFWEVALRTLKTECYPDGCGLSILSIRCTPVKMNGRLVLFDEVLRGLEVGKSEESELA